MPSPSQIRVLLRKRIVELVNVKSYEATYLTAVLSDEFGWKPETVAREYDHLRALRKIAIVNNEDKSVMITTLERMEKAATAQREADAEE